MNSTIWRVPEEYDYLGEWKTELPINCVLNKGMTGCGATSLAIEQKGSTILAVPFVGLIENKKKRYGDALLGIYGEGDKTSDVAAYLLDHPEYKIAVTYDSLPKLIRTMRALGHNPYKEAFLAIDEWHILCQQYSFRYEAARGVLDEAANFERKTFISATPLERKYWLEEIRTLPEIILEWPKAETIKVSSLNIDRPLVYMADICRDRIRKGGETNYHIFINSVEDIARIILGAGLTPDNTKVVCSSSEGRRERNEDKLPSGFKIGKAGDDPKTINFYTSTCFEGQDIFDEVGETIIVSDALKRQTMMDISTSFIQIAGRIRNSRYKNRITQIFSNSRYRRGISAEEYERETLEKLDQVQKNIDWMNTCPKDLKKAFLKQVPYMNEPYVRIVDNMVILDRNMAYQDIVNFKIVNFDYCSRVNMVNKLVSSNIEVVNSAAVQVKGALPTQQVRYSASFKDLFELYCEIQDSGTLSMKEDERITFIRIHKPEVIEAYHKLGKERVRELKYHVSNIKREIIATKDKKDDYKIVEMLSNTFPLMEPIPVKRIKEELGKIYQVIGRKATAKATDVEKWFDIRETQKQVNGKNTRCIMLLRKKLIRVFNE